MLVGQVVCRVDISEHVVLVWLGARPVTEPFRCAIIRPGKHLYSVYFSFFFCMTRLVGVVKL